VSEEDEVHRLWMAGMLSRCLVLPLLSSLGVAKGKYIACSLWSGLMRCAMALLVDASNLEKFTSQRYKNEFSVAGILCVPYCHITHHNEIFIILISDFSQEVCVLPDGDMRCAIDTCRSSESVLMCIILD
jgi:hypothetical protein